MPYEITQCYLPPGRGDFPALSCVACGTPNAVFRLVIYCFAHKIGCQLLLITNRKLHTGFRLVPTSMALNDLEGPNSLYFAFFHRLPQIFRPIISQWLKIDL